MATNFEMTAGDARKLLIPVVDGDGAAVSLDNALVRWQLSRAEGTPPAIIEKSSDAGGVAILPPESGEEVWSIEVDLAPEDTQDLKGRYFHQAQVIDEAGDPSTVLRGYGRFSRSLIRPTST